MWSASIVISLVLSSMSFMDTPSIYLTYKENSIVKLSCAPARICPGCLPDAGWYMAPSIGPDDMDNRPVAVKL